MALNDYGLIINNSAGRPVVDSRYRCLEAVGWGDIAVSNRGLHFISWSSGIQCPLVFMRSNPAAFLMNGRTGLNGHGEGSVMAISADRDTTVSYVVGGFRQTNNAPGGDYGMAVYDAQGRLGFSTQRRYVRLNQLPPSFTGTLTPSVSGDWNVANGVVFGPTTYMCWIPRRVWHNSGSVNWYLGVGVNTSSNILTLRIDAQDSLYQNGVGSFFGGPPGTDLTPGILMTTDFVP